MHFDRNMSGPINSIFVMNIIWSLSDLLEMGSKNIKIFITDYHKSLQITILPKSLKVILSKWV